MNTPQTMNIGGKDLSAAFRSKLALKQSEINSTVVQPWVSSSQRYYSGDLEFAVVCVQMISRSNSINPASRMEAAALLREFIAVIAHCKMVTDVVFSEKGIEFTCWCYCSMSFTAPGYVPPPSPPRLDDLELGLQFYLALLKDVVSSLYKDIGAPYPLPLPSSRPLPLLPPSPTVDNILQFLAEHHFQSTVAERRNPCYGTTDFFIFRGIRCFIHPTPIRDSIVTMVCAFGGSVSAGVGDLTITHEIADYLARGPGAEAVEGRIYCSSGWLFKSHRLGTLVDPLFYPMGRWW